MAPELVGWVDRFVSEGAYESRSAAMEAAVQALHRQRVEDEFAASLAMFGPEGIAEEQAMAEEGLAEWRAQLDAEDGGYGSEEAQP